MKTAVAPSATSAPRRRGRPKGGFNAAIDWSLAERLYVEGEMTDDDTGATRTFFSYAQIAARVGTSKANVIARAKRFQWASQRKVTAWSAAVVSRDRPTEEATTPPNAEKRPIHTAEEILTAYIDLFAEAVERRSVRFDTVADLDRAVRLLAFVRGQADSVKHVHNTVTLEVMQAKHRQMRELLVDADDRISGVLGSDGDG